MTRETTVWETDALGGSEAPSSGSSMVGLDFVRVRRRDSPAREGLRDLGLDAELFRRVSDDSIV